MSIQLDFFKNAINNSRLSHLYLLSGNSGSGKLELAYNVASLVLEKYDKNKDLLHNIKNNNHSQVYYIKPDGNVIKKDQILALQEEFSKTSLVNAPRIYIIDKVDLISTQAANSLLKFMEEPENNNVYGILISSNIANVLPTIISRSQVVRLDSNNIRIIFDYLLEQNINEYDSFLISNLTKSYDEALALKEDFNFNEISNYLKYFMENYPLNSFSAPLSISRDFSNLLYDRKNYLMFLQLLIVNFVEVLKYLKKEEVETKFLLNLFNENYKNYSVSKIINTIKAIQEEVNKLHTYINLSLSLEVLMLNIK